MSPLLQISDNYFSYQKYYCLMPRLAWMRPYFPKYEVTKLRRAFSCVCIDGALYRRAVISNLLARGDEVSS